MNESKIIDKYLDLARIIKNMEHEDDSDTNCNWCTWSQKDLRNWNSEEDSRPSRL